MWASGTDVVVAHCTFRNITGFAGVAVYIISGNIQLSDSVIEDNEAIEEASVLVAATTFFTMENVTFSRNIDLGDLGFPLSVFGTPITISGSQFINNTARHVASQV